MASCWTDEEFAEIQRKMYERLVEDHVKGAEHPSDWSKTEMTHDDVRAVARWISEE